MLGCINLMHSLVVMEHSKIKQIMVLLSCLVLGYGPCCKKYHRFSCKYEKTYFAFNFMFPFLLMYQQEEVVSSISLVLFFFSDATVKSFPEVTIAEEQEWGNSIQVSDAVVNLAGMPISTRWSPEVGWRFFLDCIPLPNHLLRHSYPIKNSFTSFICCFQIKKEIKQSRINVTGKVTS